MPLLEQIDDAEWFALQFDPALAKSQYNIALPSFPDDATQISFTGMCGRPNMEQAFGFYRYVRSVSGIARVIKPRIMDFGAGWGRIARLFLREVQAQDIVTCDTMAFAIGCLEKTGSAFRIIRNAPAPPIPDFEESLDLIYAYSVFSHLSEPYTRRWLDYLLKLLRPGGTLVLTTRGEIFITHLGQIKAVSDEIIDSQDIAGANEYLRILRESFPDPSIIRQLLAAGQFQFYPVGHSALPAECTGETLIPQSYFERNYSRYFVAFTEDVPSVNQAVVVLRRPENS